MKDITELYIDYVIKPIERERDILQAEIIKKGIFATKAEKYCLKKYNNLLIDRCKKLYEIMEKDLLVK